MSDLPTNESAEASSQVASQDADPCVICGHAIEAIEVTCRVQPFVGKTQAGLFCALCGMLRFPGNTGDFTINATGFEGDLRNLRNGNDERPGREFHMAQMGLEILNRPDITVTFFGAGLNTDWKWVQTVHPQVKTKLVDLENLQGLEHFESIQDGTPADIVIASEVIEHFEEPVEHFQSLFRLVKEDGILICSTNVFDGTDISQHMYPFIPGHVAYWTPMALLKVAASAGFFIDFRTPEIGLNRGGPRKKYILFYRNAETAYRVALYFGTHMLAPSEQR